MKGYTATELLATLVLVAVIITAAIPLYRDYLNSSKATDSLQTIAVLEEQLTILASTREGQLHVCDDLLANGGLDNEYLTHSIAPLSSGEAALSITAKLDTHGGDGILVAKAVLEELKGLQKSVQVYVDGDSLVSYAVRLTPEGRPFCDMGSTLTAQAAKKPAAAVAPGSQYDVRGSLTASVSEDGKTTVAGDLNVTDRLHVSAPVSLGDHVMSGSYGKLDVRTTGHWIYTLDNSSPSVQSLRAREKVQDSFSIPLPDGIKATFVVTISGASDAPRISGGGSQTLLLNTVLPEVTIDGAADLSMFKEAQRGVAPGARLTALYMPGETTNRLDGIASSAIPPVHTSYSQVGDNGFVYLSESGWFSRNIPGNLNFDPLPPSVRNNWDGGIAVFDDGSVVRLVKVCEGNGSEKDYIYMKRIDGVDATQGVSVLSGQASPGESVEVFEGNQPMGTVVADGQGHWALGTGRLGDGDHQIRTRVNGQFSLPQTVSVSGSTIAVSSSATGLGAVTVGSATRVTGKLNVTDVDHDESPKFQAQQLRGQFGSFSIDASGSWSYSIEPSRSASITAGSASEEKFTVTAISESGDRADQEVSIVVNG
ncbi:MAG: VCBS domain-containing protein [Pseudomonadales bacterium]|nr:VCBS domain-containing protein [Pseudomonadales bacterium]MBO6655486.1 VCBS domain-containing protein [Pseudomonadales bacterium]